MGDFETTVYDGQDTTLVWASASVEMYTEDVHIFHSIDEQFEYFKSLESNLVVYYHNLKFDGNFWLYYLMYSLNYTKAIEQDESGNPAWVKKQYMPRNSFTCSISDMGMWYKILIKTGKYYIELRDSLKLLPFSLKRIGQSFKTKHKKLDMVYEGFRYPGCQITDEEKSYISNDVLVIKEALEIMFDEGHNKLTIGSCCLTEYRRIIGNDLYQSLFPNLYEFPIDSELYGDDNAGEYIRHSYRGGWCYLVEGKERRMFHNGTTADVNSLYPSMMSSESKNKYPVRLPTFWKGDYIPDEAKGNDKFFFIRIRTRFYLKEGMLPTIQIKSNRMYKSTEMLKTSDVKGKDGNYYPAYYNIDGILTQAIVTLTLTEMDYYQLQEHYNLVDFEILDGCWFSAYEGIFDDYIEKYKQQKLNSKGARRELAKLFLNNLYGKMASNTDSSFKVPYMKEDEPVIGFKSVVEKGKKPGYIPVGSAITSYARNFTIKAAQANYHGVDKPGFIYADTDSIHCDLQPEEIAGIIEHEKNFCCWKLESCWDDAFFVRQKTYVEHVTHENKEPIENPYYSIRCAGMPENCKELFLKSVTGFTKEEYDKATPDEQKFLDTKREITDFDIGLSVPGKLIPKRIKGGVLLVRTDYTMQ